VCGINKAIHYCRMKQPLFNQAVREAEVRAVDDVSRILVRIDKTATSALYKAMTVSASPVASKVRAADVTFHRMLSLRELATLEARVTELERNVKAGVNRG
jgi:hypothetical protein